MREKNAENELFSEVAAHVIAVVGIGPNVPVIRVRYDQTLC